MSASIKAVCPNCRKLIRIPLDWSDRAMKCKKCGTLVQMKRRASAPTAMDLPTAPAVPLSTPYEPNYDPPAPQPSYNFPAAPSPAPHFDPQAHPYGYPSPYPMPPQYAAPAYGYPQPPQYAPPALAESVFPANDDFEPSRRKYRRGSGNAAQKIVLFAILAIVLGGMVLIGMKLSNQFGDTGGQARADDPARGKAKPPEIASGTLPPHPGPTPPPPVIVTDPFPRRMLFIHLSKYVYFNNLSPGVFGRGEDMPSVSASKLAYELRVPTDAGNNQLFVLSDTSGKPMPPPLKSVLLQTFDQFFGTSRPMDRIVVYFGGHAREIEGKAYLVPVDGDPDDVSTLLPLDDLYAKLAACKAQQKVLLWDVCRFNPGVGSARAGSEPMSEALLAKLHAVPPGVQVLTSCSAGQNAQEITETGSEFLTAFRTKARDLKMSGATSTAQPGQPIPIDKWTDTLRSHLAGKRDYAPSQTVKATVPPQDTAMTVAYAKETPFAARFAWPTVPPGASPGEVEKLLALVELPGIRKEIELPAGLAAVYPFSAEIMRAYADDGTDAESAKSDKYPVRKATTEALNYIREHWKFGDGGSLRESLNGSADEALKKEIAKDQAPIARLELELSEHLIALEVAGKKLGDEKSKRWQALYAYTLAQIQMRWAFINEYNLALGTIRTDNLEKPTGGGTPVYRLISVEKMKSKKDITEKVDAAKEAFEKIGTDHKGTPLAILAKMNKNVSLGLAWKLEVQADAAGEEKMEKKE